ncbi:MAG: hypothetical protein HPY60_11135 [Candidatus Methanofastidiosum sp.]|nr:hypothetical protein [Methanofastidiosum sp.]
MIKDIKKILRRVEKSSKDANRLYFLSKDYKIPFDIVYGIYLIETTYRPVFYRVVEYIVASFRLLLAVLFNVPINNYTVGKCQIGIGVILAFWGYSNANLYSKKIFGITMEQAVKILKSFFWQYNSIIFVWRINILYKNCSINDYNTLIRNIGYLYNGKMVYGYVLEELISKRAI